MPGHALHDKQGEAGRYVCVGGGAPGRMGSTEEGVRTGEGGQDYWEGAATGAGTHAL